MDSLTRQGYTFHTALGSMGLNHMNGRLQDAITGRFLSPDPYVTNPEYTQNFNRYSYVYNNPLSYTDPSGFGVDGGGGGGGGGWSVVITGGGSSGNTWAEYFSPDPDPGFWLYQRYGGFRGYQWLFAGIDTGQFNCMGTLEYCGRAWTNYRNTPQEPNAKPTDTETDSRSVESTVAQTAKSQSPRGGQPLQQCPRGVCMDQYAVASTVQFDSSTPDGLIKQQMADVAAGAWNAVRDVYLKITNLSLLGLGGSEVEGGAITAKTVLQATAHGAERVAGALATRGGVLSEAGIAAVRQSGRVMTQSDGATVRILETAPGRFGVVVEGQRGIITTFENLSQKSLDRLAKNYGWN